MTDHFYEKLARRAALIGVFDPLRLISSMGIEQQDQRRFLLQKLSNICHENLSKNVYRWEILPDKRRKILSRFTSRTELEFTIDDALHDWPESELDRVSKFLIQILNNKKLYRQRKFIRTTEITLDTESLHAAYQLAMVVPALSNRNCKRRYQRLNALIRSQQRYVAQVMVLPGKLFGRKAERRLLSRFIRNKFDPKNENAAMDKRPMLLTGIGGSGKSALIAAMVKWWIGRKGAPATIVLDFDKPHLSSGDPVQVVKEILKQLAANLLETKQDHTRAISDLAQIREDILSVHTFENVAISSFSGKHASILSRTIPALNESHVPAALSGPIALIFDSFEAVGKGSLDVIEMLLELENALRTDGGLPGLRTIVSGRAAPTNDEQKLNAYFGAKQRRLHLTGLNPHEGQAFLQFLDNKNNRDLRYRKFPNKKQRQRASIALKGHPLALIILDRYAQKLNETEINKLLEDLEHNEGLQAEFAQAFLYTRILDRISDPDVHQLAHPGLVLRWVSADLIRFVLAGPCGIANVDPAKADELLAKLADEYWLVEPAAGGGVRHRPDLRRLMLPGLFASARKTDSPQQKAKKQKLRKSTLAVCRKAIEYFENGPPADDPAYANWQSIDESQRALEVLYYKALCGQKPKIANAAAASELRARLSEEDFETLPTNWQAKVKFLQSDFINLTDQEMKSLDRNERQKADTAIYQIHMERGDTKAARDKLEKNSRSAEAHDKNQNEVRDLAQTSRLVDVAFAQADMEEASEYSTTVLDYFYDEISSGDLLIRDKQDYEKIEMILRSVTVGLIFSQINIEHWSSLIQKSIEKLSTNTTAFHYAAILLIGRRHLQFMHQEKDNEWISIQSDKYIKPNIYYDIYKNRINAAWLSTVDHDYIDNLLFHPTLLSLFDNSFIALLAQERSDGISIRFPGLFKEIYEGQLKETTNTNEFNRLYRSLARHPVNITSDIIRSSGPISIDILKGLRGLTPEIHQPAQFLFSQIAEKPAIEIIATLAQQNQMWPYDLIFDQYGKSKITYSPRLAPTIIETADRCGMLRQLCALMTPHRKSAAYLVQIHDLITQRFFTREQ